MRKHMVADFKVQWRGPWLADCAKEREPSSERLARQVKPEAMTPHGIARRRSKQPGQRSKRATAHPHSTCGVANAFGAALPCPHVAPRVSASRKSRAPAARALS
jgi:hypothetical protein